MDICTILTTDNTTRLAHRKRWRGGWSRSCWRVWTATGGSVPSGRTAPPTCGPDSAGTAARAEILKHTGGGIRKGKEMFYLTTHSTHFIYGDMERKEGNVLFNHALNTFYLRLYGVGHMVKDHSDRERGNPLPPHRLLFPISSKGSFICIIPQRG